MPEHGTGQLIAGGTGHRRKKIPTGNWAWLVERTRAAAVWLREDKHARIGISGMSDGFDLIWADAIVRAGMRLWVAIPYLEQPDRFGNRDDRAEWRRLRGLAEREHIAGSVAGLSGDARGRRINQLNWARNARIVLPADYLVCCWDPTQTEHCGTFNAINLARTRRHPVGEAMHIDPVAAEIVMRFPELLQSAA
jgi:hypothetical protein